MIRAALSISLGIILGCTLSPVVAAVIGFAANEILN